MTILLHVLTLGALFLLMGILTTPPGDPEKWRRVLSFLFAVLLALGMILFGFVVVVLILLGYAAVAKALGFDAGILLGTLVVVVAGGVLLFIIMRPVMRLLRVTHERLAIIEYYIQWTLIYMTVYQVVVGQLESTGGFLGDAELTQEISKLLGNVLNPDAVVILLLPVLISVWIATAMLKIRIENQTATDADLDTIRRRPVDNPG